MPAEIEVKGLQELINKVGRITPEIQRAMDKTMEASLNTLHENVPSYPRKPEASSYIRQGILGKSIGSSEAGGKSGEPTVYSIKGSGAKIEGRFGTDLSYAKYVIDPDRQAYMHRGRWWTTENIVKASKSKILRLWDKMIQIVKRRLNLR
jgi:hypothetical protein